MFGVEEAVTCGVSFCDIVGASTDPDISLSVGCKATVSKCKCPNIGFSLLSNNKDPIMRNHTNRWMNINFKKFSSFFNFALVNKINKLDWSD